MKQTAENQDIGFFERYLTVWVILCMVAGIFISLFAGDSIHVISDMEAFGVNIPVAILVWFMIYPMMVQIDFSSILKVGSNAKGLGLTLFVNWLVKPFTMALLSYYFFYMVFGSILDPEVSESYLAGAILLGAAPCTAMVFVWSYLSKGDPNYTLMQVSVNDLVLLIAFIPIVAFLFEVFDITFLSDTGVELGIPFDTLITSVVLFVVIPLTAGYLTNRILVPRLGKKGFKQGFVAKLRPFSILALLLTLVLLFAFQGSQIVAQPLNILLIAIPLTIQTYLIFLITWALGRFLKLRYNICAPASMIGASNFFELAVAVAISLFGLNSGASLATVVGVLIEVPVMLSLVAIAKRWKYA